MSDASSDGGFDQEDVSPMIEVVYPVGEETEVPQTRGQLFKTVLVEGTGSKPPKGAKVTVHYVGTLASDGSKFDSSRDRGEYFDFTIGQGQVIKGWDTGVATMRKGEKSILRCLPEYGYGASGSPPKIPPNSTLNFEVELFDWTKSDDISEDKDKSLMKKTVVEGKDWERPDYETEVTMDFAVLKNGDDDAEVVADKKDWKIVIGETDLPSGVEEALKTMKNGEVAEVECKKLSVGHPDFPQLVVGQPAYYRIAIKTFTKVKTWDAKGTEKITQAAKRKDQGNAYFVNKDYARALQKYKRGLEYIEHEYGIDEADKPEARKLKISMWSNTAQCALSTGKYADCVANCNKVLAEDPGNAKALFRRGKAQGLLQEWDEGIKDLKKVLEMDPSNADVARELQVVQEALRQHNAKQKAKYGNMFAKMAAMEEKEKQSN